MSRHVPGMVGEHVKRLCGADMGKQGDDIGTTYGTQKDFILYGPHRDFVGTKQPR